MKNPKYIGLSLGSFIFLLTALYTNHPVLKGSSLACALALTVNGAIDSKREAILARIAKAERQNEIERAVLEQELMHQAEMEALIQRYGAAPSEAFAVPDSRAVPVEQPQLPGGHIHQPTLPTGAGRTQGAPAQRVSGNGENPGETGETLDRFTWETLEPLLLSYPAVLLVGAQGSGKTTMAQYLASQKLRAGEQVIALDPHWKRGDWSNCQIVGAGKDYGAIDNYLKDLLAEVDRRYQLRQSGQDNFPPLTVICEELTQWGDRVPTSQEFILSAMSDFRKIAIRVIFLSHGKTNALMGGSKGTKATREATLATLELGVTLTRSGARPTGKAALSLPGMPDQVLEVPDLRTTPAAPPPAPVEVEVMDADDPSPTLTAIAREFAPMLEASLGEPDWVAPLRECAQGGQCSVRDFQRCAWARKAQFSADDCRGIFSIAERIEIGCCLRDGDGEIIGFSLSP